MNNILVIGSVNLDLVFSVDQFVKAGETIRYRCDRPHIVRNVSKKPAHATMICILKAAVMD